MNDLEKEIADNERWMREVLTDFRIPFDDHKIGRRLAFTRWMAEHQSVPPHYHAVFPSVHARMPTAMFLNPIDAKNYKENRCQENARIELISHNK